MTDQTSNDNDGAASAGAQSTPDGHGQAAMLLVESLLHALVERSVITLEEAIETVDVAAEVEQAMAAERGDLVGPFFASPLQALGRSLRLDLDGRA